MNVFVIVYARVFTCHIQDENNESAAIFSNSHSIIKLSLRHKDSCSKINMRFISIHVDRIIVAEQSSYIHKHNVTGIMSWEIL